MFDMSRKFLFCLLFCLLGVGYHICLGFCRTSFVFRDVLPSHDFLLVLVLFPLRLNSVLVRKQILGKQAKQESSYGQYLGFPLILRVILCTGVRRVSLLVRSLASFSLIRSKIDKCVFDTECCQ